VSQQAPTLQFISSNPRNIALTVRGLGRSFGLANDAWNKVWASIR
jgi:iron complex outermembrane receptor protein